MDLTAWHHRNLLVQEVGETAKDAALRLSAQTEQNEVVPGEDGVDELRNDGLVVSDDSGEERLAGLQLLNKIVADFLLDRPRAQTRPPQVPKGMDGHHSPILSDHRNS